ncbi:hypothetical protein EKH57_03915 [Halorubrum sp. BOL3-1]|uniref:hypothetical protein n=1 Tax=Halorubrum sp. BOL3-1 TaxID=2497325 RepID=UPI00100520AA|nr:hypothetical protein [Halorubrum sp. BOL3-1]QAU11964.1 hypothetical protein EKH57_03915 [Halorubrum sp. BOL3-1]
MTDHATCLDAAPAVDALSSVAPIAYAPMTYDGATTVSSADPDDEDVLRTYHRHMSEYRAGGPDGATALARAVTDVIATGPSSWRIEPPYADGGRTVLAHPLNTIESAVAETGRDASDWAVRRRAALASGRLEYAARNRDLLVRS